jgi:uncharacterized membrane protein
LKVAINSAILSIVAILLQVFILVKFGWLRDWIPGISQWFVLLFNPASISVMLFIAYSIFIRKRTGSTRMSAIALFTVSVVALIIFTVIGIWFRGANWEFSL